MAKNIKKAIPEAERVTNSGSQIPANKPIEKATLRKPCY